MLRRVEHREAHVVFGAAEEETLVGDWKFELTPTMRD
jgi:hypothetical protein